MSRNDENISNLNEVLKKRLKISRLIAEEITGTISKDNLEELIKWMNESLDNKEEYFSIKKNIDRDKEDKLNQINVQEFWNNVNQKLPRKKTNIYFRIASYAASILLVISFTFFFFVNRDKEQSGERITVADGKPILVLSDGKTVTLHDSLHVLEDEKANTSLSLNNDIIHYNENEFTTNEVNYHTLIIPKGGEYQVQLPDGTKVWLNSETELRYPISFTGDCRKVYLSGEANFDVVSNPEQPFIVKTTSNVEIKVLGTIFNITSYEEDEEVITTLESGSVQININGEEISINPNEQIIYDKTTNNYLRKEVNAKLYSSWKNGKFIFDNQPLEEIMKKLQRWYKMEVEFSNEELKNYRFSGDLKKYEDFEKIVSMLEEVSNCRLIINNRKVYIRKK